MHHPTDRITHTTAFVTPVVEHWLERKIAQWLLIAINMILCQGDTSLMHLCRLFTLHPGHTTTCHLLIMSTMYWLFLIVSVMTEHTAVFITGRSKPGVSVLIFNTRYVSMSSYNRV